MLTELRRFRKELGITLDGVAGEIGISVGYLNRIERGLIKDVKNTRKKQRLVNYIEELRERYRQKRAESQE